MERKKKNAKSKTDTIHLRFSPELLANWSRRAAAEGFKLTTWIRAKLLKALGSI